MVTYVFDRLVDAGMRRIIVNTHHCPEKWDEAFPDWEWRGVPLVFRHEEVLLGTAGGLKNIDDLVGGETIFLHSGDVLTDLSLVELLEFHGKHEAEVTLALRKRPGVETIGRIGNGHIVHVGRPPLPDGAEGYDYANVAVLDAAFLARIPNRRPRDIANVWGEMAAEGAEIVGLPFPKGWWFNVGTPKEYAAVNENAFPPL